MTQVNTLSIIILACTVLHNNAFGLIRFFFNIKIKSLDVYLKYSTKNDTSTSTIYSTNQNKSIL